MTYLRYVVPCLLVALLSAALAAQTKNSLDEPVSGAGCVVAGVERGCLVLYDPETQTNYNLFFHGEKPASGTPIQFTGAFNRNSVSFCMQGKIVHVTQWRRTGAHCNPPSRDR